MGQVCAKHNEYYEDRCRWCEAPETDAYLAALRVAYARPLVAALPDALTPPNDGHGALE